MLKSNLPHCTFINLGWGVDRLILQLVVKIHVSCLVDCQNVLGEVSNPPSGQD